MTFKAIIKLHRIVGYLSMAGVLVTTVLATLSMINGYLESYVINAMILLVCSALTVINFRRARHLEGQLNG